MHSFRLPLEGKLANTKYLTDEVLLYTGNYPLIRRCALPSPEGEGLLSFGVLRATISRGKVVTN
jgi:hypothetical protein